MTLTIFLWVIGMFVFSSSVQLLSYFIFDVDPDVGMILYLISEIVYILLVAFYLPVKPPYRILILIMVVALNITRMNLKKRKKK